jgi:hypothetical protein
VSSQARRLALLALLLLAASSARAQILIPIQPHETLELQLHSMRDQVTLYMGIPQELLRMDCRPAHVEPRIEYTHQRNAVLRIRDQQLFQKQPPADLETLPEKQRKQYLSDAQTWEARLYPFGPTKFFLQIDDGVGVLDFTDFEVQEVRLKAENTKLDLEFGRQNPIQMELFTTQVKNGSMEFRKVLNARAKTMAFITNGSVCTFEITGKEYEGETEIVVDGDAQELNFVFSKKIGLRIDGPADVVARFESKQLSAEGKSLVSKNFADAKCKVRLNVAKAAPKMNVDWD